MLILQCIIGLQSQSIDFINDFSKADTTSVEPFFIEMNRYFKSDGGQGDIFLRLNKHLYSQAEASCL